MLIAIFIFAAVLLILVLTLRRQKRRAGISGWVKDQDLDGGGKRLYYSPEINIVCKPDIIEGKKVTEHKSADVIGYPPPYDILQLAAQILAVGADSGDLQYPESTFVFTREHPEIQDAFSKLKKITWKMEEHLRENKPPEATPTLGRCRVCEFRNECGEAAR